MQTLTESGIVLGPATVREIAGDRLRLDRPQGEAWARLALAQPYEPEPGDIVLAIGDEEVYVIGVLLGRGRTKFCVPGDLELHARGTVDIRGMKGIRLRSPEVEIRADRVETVAHAIFERTIDCYRWVRDLFQTRSGRTRTMVEGQHSVVAERIVQRAKKDVKIDGRKIHLG
jgi:hypothetical protein